MRTENNYFYFSLFFSISGIILSIISYQSVEPFFLILFFWLLILVSNFLLLSTREEYFFCFYILSFFTFFLGLASIFNIILESINDDEEFFYLTSIGAAEYSRLIFFSFDGYGAVYTWKFFYDFFSNIGFSKIPLIGLSLNMYLMTISGLLVYKAALIIYSKDSNRVRRLFILYPLNGLILIFASTHLREAFSFFLITSLLFFWVLFIINPKIKNLIILFLVNSLSYYSFDLIRPEFLFVPVILGMCFLFAVLMTNKKENVFYFKGLKFISLFILFVSIITLFQSDLYYLLFQAYEGYLILNREVSNSASMGTSLIVEAPIIVRIILGSIYLLIFPIPFWSELSIDSYYHLLKFLNVIYFYFFIPLFILSIFYFFKIKFYRSVVNYFLLISFFSFLFAVSMTSLETRHLGQFLPLIFLFSLIPSLKQETEVLNFYKIFTIFIFFIISIHMAWILLRI